MSTAETIHQFFPYDTIRPQQNQIMKFINQCWENGETAIIEAATGVGKTIAALSPLIHLLRSHNATAEDDNRLKLVVVSRTHSQADRVIDELQEIMDQTGKSIPALSKRGKQALCINDEVKSQPATQFHSICSSFKKRKKCKPFVNAMIPQHTAFTEFLVDKPLSSTTIIKDSRANNCCPAEITNKLIKGVDIIACSYHYLFSDIIRERFLQSLEVPLENLVIVVDECHNLPDATIQMNTIRLSSTQVSNAELEVRRSNFGDDLINLQQKYTVFLQALYSVMHIDEEQTISAMDLLKQIEKKMQQHGYNQMLQPGMVEDLRKLSVAYLNLSSLRHFAYLDYIADAVAYLFKLLSRRDELILQFTYHDRQYLELKVMDPKFEIANVVQHAKLSVLMTGTLGNPYVFRAQSGLYKETQVLQLPSPYEQELGVYQVRGLTSKYTERGEKMYSKYVEIIHRICTANVNVGLYVTSYKFLGELFEHGLDRMITPIFRAERSMNSYETEQLITQFKHTRLKGGGLLCSVMGGRSSEGADFPGEEMEVVIIAGVPYPPKTMEQDARFTYYSELTKSAWNICYTTPAFTAINQAAGRAVRSLSDRAMIFLLDDRVSKNTKRLTGWLQTGFEIIEQGDIDSKVASYFQ